MQVSDGMSSVILTIGLSHTLRDAARAEMLRLCGEPDLGDETLLTPKPAAKTENQPPKW